jgi:hypothetical protein
MLGDLGLLQELQMDFYTFRLVAVFLREPLVLQGILFRLSSIEQITACIFTVVVRGETLAPK